MNVTYFEQIFLRPFWFSTLCEGQPSVLEYRIKDSQFDMSVDIVNKGLRHTRSSLDEPVETVTYWVDNSPLLYLNKAFIQCACETIMWGLDIPPLCCWDAIYPFSTPLERAQANVNGNYGQGASPPKH